MAVDLQGPQAKALHAKVTKLCTEFNKAYPSGAVQKAATAPTATLGVGAGTSTSTSAPPLPRPTPHAPIVPMEMAEQKKERHRKQLNNHWNQVQNFLSTCPET